MEIVVKFGVLKGKPKSTFRKSVNELENLNKSKLPIDSVGELKTGLKYRLMKHSKFFLF